MYQNRIRRKILDGVRGGPKGLGKLFHGQNREKHPFFADLQKGPTTS